MIVYVIDLHKYMLWFRPIWQFLLLKWLTAIFKSYFLLQYTDVMLLSYYVLVLAVWVFFGLLSRCYLTEGLDFSRNSFKSQASLESAI